MILIILDDASAEGDGPGNLIVEEYGSINSKDLQAQHQRQPTMIEQYEWHPGTSPPSFLLPLNPFFETIPAVFDGRSQIQLSPHILACGWRNIQAAWARALKERRVPQGGA